MHAVILFLRINMSFGVAVPISSLNCCLAYLWPILPQWTFLDMGLVRRMLLEMFVKCIELLLPNKHFVLVGTIFFAARTTASKTQKLSN